MNLYYLRLYFFYIIPDPIVINKVFANSEDCIQDVIDPHLETEKNVENYQDGANEDSIGIRIRALSTPDFMASYKPAHDPDRYLHLHHYFKLTSGLSVLCQKFFKVFFAFHNQCPHSALS